MRPVLSGRSLGQRLFVSLALLAAAGLSLLSMTVYSTTRMGLEQRQDALLREKQLLVRYLLEDQDLRSDSTAIKARLDDVFFGDQGMSLVLRTSDRSAVYRSGPEETVARGREVQVIREFMPMFGQSGTTLATFSLDVSDDDAVLQRLSRTLGVATLAGVVLVAWVGFLVVRFSLSPIRRLVEQTRSLAPDALDERLDPSGQPDELRPLVEQFNALLERHAGAYEQIKAFNADVAHELRTPLATLIVDNELTLRGRRAEAEFRDMLSSNLEELHRLAGIVNDMLFLSHADRGDRARRRSVTSLADVAREVVVFHDAVLQENALSACVSGDASGAFDAPLLRQALSNILANATRYARPGSVIQIGIQPSGGSADRVTITVQNEGETIDPIHMPRLFDRFYRIEAARTGSDRNHGLGLAIVSAIARMHDGEAFATSVGGVTRIGITAALASPSNELPAHEINDEPGTRALVGASTPTDPRSPDETHRPA